MEVKIDDSEIKKAVHAAILQSLDAAKREAMISAAISHLFIEKGDYGRKTSVVQEIFNPEVVGFAREEVRRRFSEDAQFKERLGALVAAAIDKGFNAENSQLIDNMAALIAGAITPKREF